MIPVVLSTAIARIRVACYLYSAEPHICDSIDGRIDHIHAGDHTAVGNIGEQEGVRAPIAGGARGTPAFDPGCIWERQSSKAALRAGEFARSRHRTGAGFAGARYMVI